MGVWDAEERVGALGGLLVHCAGFLVYHGCKNTPCSFSLALILRCGSFKRACDGRTDVATGDQCSSRSRDMEETRPYQGILMESPPPRNHPPSIHNYASTIHAPVRQTQPPPPSFLASRKVHPRPPNNLFPTNPASLFQARRLRLARPRTLLQHHPPAIPHHHPPR